MDDCIALFVNKANRTQNLNLRTHL